MLDDRMIDDATSVRGVRDRMLQLRSLGAFQGLDDHELLLLAERMRLRHFEVDQLLLEEHRSIDRVFVVVEGSVAISRGGERLGRIPPGNAAGLLAAFSGEDEGVEGRAEVETSAFELAVPVLEDAFKRCPSLLRHFVRRIAAHLLESRGFLPSQTGGAPPLGCYEERPMTLAEKIMIMRTGGVMSTAHLDAVFEMVRRSQELRVKAGETLWELGDPATFSSVIDYGLVRCTRGDASTVVGRRYLLGGLESLAAAPRPYGAVAESDLVLLRFERESFLAVLETHADVGMSLLSALSLELLKTGRL